MYANVQHPETNDVVSAYNTQERLMHIAEVKRRTNSEIPWLCDTEEFELKQAVGGAPNGEIVLDPEGRIVRKRFWSDPETLRADLTEFVGGVENPTQIEDIDVAFRVESREIASNVVPRLELPGRLMPLQIEPVAGDEGIPFYAKLRAESTSGLVNRGSGQLYLGFYLDPLYKVHWNNRMAKFQVSIDSGAGELNGTTLDGPDVDPDSDIDPRQFLIDLDDVSSEEPIEITVSYAVCDDAETFCINVEQQYRVVLETDEFGGTRPGIFLVEMFNDVEKMDANGDGHLTADELPPGRVSLYIGHMDKNSNGQIDAEEIADFKAMFNNGEGFLTDKNDGG
ncbi:MAG: hypothetical protein AAF456_24045 [Planctomycetota bacterium]